MLTLQAENITGDNSACMEWKYYWRNVVQRYKVVIEGWPGNVPFRNLSDATSSLPDLEGLLQRWRNGKAYWKAITDRELRDLDVDREAQIENGDLNVPPPRWRRSDAGKKRQQKGTDNSEVPKKRRKSKKTVVDSEAESSDNEDDEE